LPPAFVARPGQIAPFFINDPLDQYAFTIKVCPALDSCGRLHMGNRPRSTEFHRTTIPLLLDAPTRKEVRENRTRTLPLVYGTAVAEFRIEQQFVDAGKQDDFDFESAARVLRYSEPRRPLYDIDRGSTRSIWPTSIVRSKNGETSATS
jgi:hypothetical protein